MFGIGYDIGQKYQPILVSVLDLNQNSGFGRTLHKTDLQPVSVESKFVVENSKLCRLCCRCRWSCYSGKLGKCQSYVYVLDKYCKTEYLPK